MPVGELRGADEAAMAMSTPASRRRRQTQPHSPKTPPRAVAAAPSAGRLGENPCGSTSTTATTTSATAPSSTWTLYDNPCFCSSHFYPDPTTHRHRRRHHHHHHHRKPLTPENPPTPSSFPMREQLGTVLERERAMVALERERDEAEALRVELARERRRREEADHRAAKAAQEAARWKAEAERMQGEVQEQRARAELAEERCRLQEQIRVQTPTAAASGRRDPAAPCGGNKVVIQCDRSKEQQQQQQASAGTNLSPATTPSQPQKHPHPRRDASPAPVENPHIRRGIIGFVEFPRVVGRSRNGPAATTGKPAGPPKLECQKAQLRVLLKGGGGGKVAPVAGFPSSAPPAHSLVM